MPTDYDNDLLREGIFHYRVKEYDLARNYIQRALETADDMQTRAQANYYLSLLTVDPIQRRQFLEDTLSIDSTHAEARRALAVLDGKLNASEIVNPETLPAPSAGRSRCRLSASPARNAGAGWYLPRMAFRWFANIATRAGACPRRPTAGNRIFSLPWRTDPVSGYRSKCPRSVARGCGATFVLAVDQISATCAYCGSVHVVATAEKRKLIEPDSILPMAFDQKQANWKLVHWVEAMKVVPQEQVQAPRGLYLPVWMFDIFGNIPWKGMTYRDKRMVPVSGEKTIHFEEVRILGSKKVGRSDGEAAA